ncbi:MAG TPA: YceI family protein [Polyangiaceae bacterium]|nr:YceI family protein [Polyangiaceae bacterium]
MRKATGSVHVFTFKEGVLSAAAHDLRLSAQKFDVALDGDRVRAEFDLKALVVEGPMENGVLNAAHYDASKRAEVEKAMHGSVLHTEKHPKAVFAGTATESPNGFEVNGELELVGRRAPLSFSVRKDGTMFRSAFEFNPSKWGIAQYKALLGAIRLKDVVRIEFSLTEES